MKDLSVIVPFVNEYPQVAFTLQSIQQSLKGRLDFEILAVDNFVEEEMKRQGRERDKSGDAVKAGARVNPKTLKYIEYGSKLSHWQAKNYAVSKSEGEVLWFCDAHCIVSRDAVWEMFKYYMRCYERINGTLHLPLTYKILEASRLIYKLVYKDDQDRPATDTGDLSYSFTRYRDEQKPYEVSCMSTCGMMMSREIYDRLGGWPKELGIYRGGEHFVNFVMATMGMKKWIFPGHCLHHHGEKRGYEWNYDDSVRNRFIANYMFGGDRWLSTMRDHTKGRPEVLQKIYENVKLTCSEHRRMLKEKQTVRIEDWIDKWVQP